MAYYPEYLWIVILGFIFGFVYAFGIGANDVANAFGSTVASKSLTLKQAIVVAGIFEFLGALLLGASVTSTVRSGIFDPAIYEDEPDIVLLGQFSTIITGTLMLLTATYYGLPVSTTHTIVASTMGFSIVAKGFSSINWNTVTNIFISWVISPLVSGILAFLFFGSIKKFIFKHERTFERAYYTFPLILTIFIGIDVFYVIYKGFNNKDFTDDLNLAVVIPVSFGIGLLVGLFWIVWWGPRAKKRIIKREEEKLAKEGVKKSLKEKQNEVDDDGDAEVQKLDAQETTDPETTTTTDPDLEASWCPDYSFQTQAKKADEVIETTKKADEVIETPEVVEPPEEEENPTPEEEEEEPKGFFKKKMRDIAAATYEQDLEEQALEENKDAADIWAHAEVFDWKSEQLFVYVQVFTACLNSFAHGANDVANAIAPLSSILMIYQTGEVDSKAPVEKWILVYGGLGIVIGLALYGYKVMKSIGYKVTVLTPSRGSSAELAASLFVVTASFLGIPVSTTQSISGAIVGVGLVGGRHNVQWWYFLRIVCGWVVIFFVSIILSAGIFSMFAFTPSL